MNHILWYMNGNADNQNLLTAVTHWVERTDFDQVGSLVLFNRNMLKSTTGFSHAPLKTVFTLHRINTMWSPVSVACHNCFEFYLFERNFIRWFLPRERSGSTCICIISSSWILLSLTRFYDPLNPLGSCWAWSVNLFTLFLDRLSPLSG